MNLLHLFVPGVAHHAQEQHDFVDRAKGESVKSVRDRRGKTVEMLQTRGAHYCTPAHLAAFVLDPRNVHLVNDPTADETCGYTFAPAWQEAVSATMNQFIPRFWQTEAWEG